MKRIVLNSLYLKDFKGIKEQFIALRPGANAIVGANATGKTTIVDAFMWLLFDKDSHGRADFSIKPYDKDGREIHNLDTTVQAEVLVNEEPIILKKIFREKWTKPRGQVEVVFSGHEQVYYWNDVPLAQKDFARKIEDVCPEKVFKLLTNPLYFTKLPWQEQRSMLFNIAGNVTNENLSAIAPAYTDLLAKLNGAKSIDEYKKEIASKKRIIKQDLETIPARIDEVSRNIPQPLMWTAIEKEIALLDDEIRALNSQILDISKNLEGENQKRVDIQKVIYGLQTKKREIENGLERHLEELRQNIAHNGKKTELEIQSIRMSISHLNGSIGLTRVEVSKLNERLTKKKAEWQQIKASKPYIAKELTCPYCQQPLPDDFQDNEFEKAERKFNEDKAALLAENVESGKKLNEQIAALNKEIEVGEQKIAELESKVVELQMAPDQEAPKLDEEKERATYLFNKDYENVCQAIEIQQRILSDLGSVTAVSTDELLSEQKRKMDALSELRKQLSQRDVIASGHKRLDELKAQQKELSQALADLEKVENIIIEGTKAKINLIENRINQMFRTVRFKMFNQQINGGEQETCECTLNGVPFADVNNAGKINAGLDIISVLAKEYDIQAPIFIDNRESVNKLLDIDSQVISLIVTTDNQLQINTF